MSNQNNNKKSLSFGDRNWPALTEDGKVPTADFLDACETIVMFFSELGKIFAPVRKDIEGNVNKLRTQYLTNPIEFEYVHDIIIVEIKRGSGNSIESLLWLKRGLHFTCRLLMSIVDDHDKSVNEESLCRNLEMAYEISLKEHHNWMVQKFFSACVNSRMCPQRTELMKTLAGKANTSGDEFDGALNHAQVTIPKLRAFVNGLETNLKSLFELYVKHGLDTREHV